MKKHVYIILYILVFIAFSKNLYSQKKFEFGLYLGTSITSMSNVDDLANTLSAVLTQTAGKEFEISKSARSFLLNSGGFIACNFSPSVALKGGLEYAQKGVKFTGECYLNTNIHTYSSQVAILQLNLNLSYFEFPISIQFTNRTKDDQKNLYYYFNLGISPAIQTSAKQITTVRMVERGFNSVGVTENPIGESENDTQNLDGINEIDYGAFCSVGLFGKSNWFAELKYEQGLTNTMKNKKDGNVINSSFAACFGYKF